MIDPTALSGVQRTALVTLRARAEEHQRPDRLFRDAMAFDWWSRVQASPDLLAAYQRSPIWQLNIAVRTRLIDTAIERLLGPQALHVIELGVGLSTLPYRIGHERLHWVGVDGPEVVALRRTLTPPPVQEHLIAESILESAWIDALPQSPPAQMVFVAEGLFLYLERATIQQLIARLQHRFRGALLLFNAYSNHYAAWHGEQFQAIQAPLQWTIQDRHALAELGVNVGEIWSTLDYDPERTRDVLQEHAPHPLPDAIRDMHLVIEARL